MLRCIYEGFTLLYVHILYYSHMFYMHPSYMWHGVSPIVLKMLENVSNMHSCITYVALLIIIVKMGTLDRFVGILSFIPHNVHRRFQGQFQNILYILVVVQVAEY